MGFPYGYSPG